MDPFPSEITGGEWQSIRGQRELVFMGGDRMLEWEPPTGYYRLWQYDHSYAQRDPLPGGPLAEGTWGSIRTGHQLVYLFEDRLLDWEPASGNFRIWQFDRNAQGRDPLPNEVAQGHWGSINGQHRLMYIDADQVLDWDPPSGGFRLWRYDRYSAGDPFPDELAAGEWGSIRTGHELVYLSRNRMLDWEPQTGHYRVWQVARSGNDCLPGSPTADPNRGPDRRRCT